MIVVPTAEFLGILTDVLPFAPEDKNDPLYGVLLEWDGNVLTAHATDTLSAGMSTWSPEDLVDLPEADDMPVYGPTDDDPAWRVMLAAPDVVEIVKTFKVAFKFRGIPLSLKVSPTGARFIVERSRDTGKSEHLVTVQPTGEHVRFPDLRAQIDDHLTAPAVTGRSTVWGHRLAAFTAAGRRGPAELIYTEPPRPIVVRVGDRFRGFVSGQQSRRAAAIQTVDILRDGSGLLLGSEVTRQDNGTVMVEND